MDSTDDLWRWLHAAQSRGVQPGLERMERLLAALGNPENHLQCLHVAGTNGKGSVCAFAESMLRAEGYRTGLYTSPHLVNFEERIKIEGVPASKAEIEIGIARLRSVTSGWSEEELPTYFELVTALAFDLFERAGCDIIVLETGLGGKLDATNTAPKIACAITPIALDHCEWLGETLTQIAWEKAGILRSGIPVVIAPQEEEAAEAFRSAVRKIGTPSFWSSGEFPLHDLRLGLAGSHQRRNAVVALELLKVAGFELSEGSVRKGLAEVSWPGRFQRLFKQGWNAELILDGAHNLHAVRQLVETWCEEFGDRRYRLIFGALSDKDPEALLAVLAPLAEEIWLVPVASPRSFSFNEYGTGSGRPYRLCGSLKEAMKIALGCSEESATTRSAPVLLTGSLFLVGEALALLSGTDFTPRSQ